MGSEADCCGTLKLSGQVNIAFYLQIHPSHEVSRIFGLPK